MKDTSYFFSTSAILFALSTISVNSLADEGWYQLIAAINFGVFNRP